MEIGDTNVLRHIMASERSKNDIIDERQAKLPLPDDPPKASDWNSADARNVKDGPGAVESGVSTGNGSTSGLREPATKGSGVREEGGVDLSGVGGEGKEGGGV